MKKKKSIASKNIKPLESKYMRSDNTEVLIPIPARTEMYGCPLIRVELVPLVSHKRKEGITFGEILLGIADLHKEGYTMWRSVKCNTPALEIGAGTGWNLIEMCKNHGAPRIQMYAPSNAKYMQLTHLYTGFGSFILWLDANKKELPER
jgi:hypothetical protein